VHSPSDQDTEQGWRNAINSMAERLSLVRVKRLIPVSGSLERYLLRRGYKPESVKTVWNGVPVHDLVRRSRDPSGAFVVGMVALFRPRKGVETLLRAIAQLRGDGHDVRMHAVGPFETEAYEAEVKQLVVQLGLVDVVHWTGFTDKVFAEFSYMHAFALPSLFGEGMPMVVLEAMAAGLPVISTRVEGIPEVVREGQDGLLADAGNADQFAAALLKLVSGEVDADAMGDCARLRQREHFSDMAMASGVAAVYREVLAG